MAVELSTRKIRVTKLHGSDAYVGLVTPLADMYVRHGIEDRWVIGWNATGELLNLAASSGGTVIQQAYPHQLSLDYATASGYWGYPSASGAVEFHHDTPDFFGTPVGSGMVYWDGDEDVTFGR